MIYRLINGDSVIGSVISKFNIDNSDWIAKSPQWILDCLDDIRIVSDLETHESELTIVDNKILLPCDIKSLKGVVYNDTRVYAEDSLDGKTDGVTYKLLNNNYLLFNRNYTFDNGETALLYWKGFPISDTSIYNIPFPMIPDNSDLVEAISYYILMLYLQHGYKHPVFDLNSNNMFTNPALKYYGADNKSGLRLVARNSVKTLNADERYNLNQRLSMLNSNEASKREKLI